MELHQGLRPGSFQGEETSVSTVNRIGSAIQQRQVKAEILNYAIDKRPTGLILISYLYATLKVKLNVCFAIERDITEFKQLEKELKNRQTMRMSE
ncbi:hypothetical protein O9929_17830 [Vibrio lentus]|nr:hypothetical protein [Vibrio lentus]